MARYSPWPILRWTSERACVSSSSVRNTFAIASRRIRLLCSVALVIGGSPSRWSLQSFSLDAELGNTFGHRDVRHDDFLTFGEAAENFDLARRTAAEARGRPGRV